MERLSTGVHELDRILAGGLPTGGLVVIAGPPGSGKSILAHQIAFTNATPQRPGLYYSTTSESHAKIVRHLDGMTFFDPDAIGTRVHLLHLSEFVQQARTNGDGLAAVVDEVVGAVYQRSPHVAIVDSSRALADLGSAEQVRTATFELAAKIGHSGTVVIFVGEYDHSQLTTAPEFAVADVVLELANDPGLSADQRTLRVAKLRGSRFLAGRHPFSITSAGLQIHARLDSDPAVLTDTHDGRASLGDPQLDAMTGGGIPRGDATLLLGPSGVGKTALAQQFLAAGLAEGEPGLYVALEENPAEAIARADSFGLKLSPARDAGLLHIVHGPPGQTDLDHLGHQLRDQIATHQPRRIVVDSMSSLTTTIRQGDRSPAYEAALSATLRAHGATLMSTFEVSAMGNGGPHGDTLSHLANNVIVLRYMERGSELGRVLSVLKMRRSHHDKGLLQFTISDHGLQITGQADDVRHITGWTVLGSPTHT